MTIVLKGATKAEKLFASKERNSNQSRTSLLEIVKVEDFIV